MDTISKSNTIALGDTTMTSIVERDGPYHNPYDMFPEATPERVEKYLADLPSHTHDPLSLIHI